MNLKEIQNKVRGDRALIPGNRSFFLRPKGRPKSHVLLLHGFSACPYEILELGKHLQKKGHLAYAPRLAGHGTNRADFDAHGLSDWLADAEKAFAALEAAGRKRVLIGHSGGGALAALLAARHAGKISGLVLGAPAFKLADPTAPLSLLSLARFFKPTLDFNIPHADASIHWTLRYSTHRVAELVRLGRQATEAAKALKLPLLLLQAKGDGIVSRPFNESLFRKIPSPAKRLEIYETDEHNVFHHHNPLQARVFAWVDAFLKSL